MTYNLDISEEKNLATITPKGTCTIIDMKALVYILIKDPLYIPTLDLLIDKREMKYTPVISEVLEVSNFVIPLKHHFKGKIAIVANGELLYDMFKLSSRFTSSKDFYSNIFHNPEEALAWIADPDTPQSTLVPSD